jgi:hypothetical protein
MPTDARQNRRPALAGAAFAVTETEVIVRPWEVTLTLPVPEGPLRWEFPVPHRLMGIDCLVGRVRRWNVLTGFGLFFPPTRAVISVDVLPGMGVNLVDVYLATYTDDAARGNASWQSRPPEVMDERVLLALVRMAGRIPHTD